MELGPMLRAARGGRSLREAAEVLGIDKTNYKLWEAGVRMPQVHRAGGIAEFIGVSKTEVLRALGAIGEDEQVTPIRSGRNAKRPVRTGTPEMAADTISEVSGAVFSTLQAA